MLLCIGYYCGIIYQSNTNTGIYVRKIKEKNTILDNGYLFWGSKRIQGGALGCLGGGYVEVHFYHSLLKI